MVTAPNVARPQCPVTNAAFEPCEYDQLHHMMHTYTVSCADHTMHTYAVSHADRTPDVGERAKRATPPLRSSKEWLPRFSSENFPQEAIKDPILDIVLEPGDLLYFPRGVIHQGVTLPDVHSLHITISSYQKNTWGDLFEKLVPVALKIAIEEDAEFRTGLPSDYLRYMGVAHSDFESEGRSKFIDKVSSLMKRLFDHAPIDAAVDQMGKQLMHDALPPYISPGPAS
ncbi:hypothetical protein J437_LFUL010548 [Ladona fulva]|uniref:Bifunctional lysine-specific demethylase and histidyl-hydroxylase n=1 Tax=Ladona fulva TaxID=123851 RepID=A0A8K0P536_LADFU|nr:hypothetical protein J437_LFUL010548 [Ladona fulva]